MAGPRSRRPGAEGRPARAEPVRSGPAAEPDAARRSGWARSPTATGHPLGRTPDPEDPRRARQRGSIMVAEKAD
jgi:hypothetical protein